MILLYISHPLVAFIVWAVSILRLLNLRRIKGKAGNHATETGVRTRHIGIRPVVTKSVLGWSSSPFGCLYIHVQKTGVGALYRELLATFLCMLHECHGIYHVWRKCGTIFFEARDFLFDVILQQVSEAFLVTCS